MGIFDFFRRKPVTTTPLASDVPSVPVSREQQRTAKSIGSPAPRTPAPDIQRIIKPTIVSGGGGGSSTPTKKAALIRAVEERQPTQIERVQPKPDVETVQLAQPTTTLAGRDRTEERRFGTFGEPRQEVQERGMLFVTPEEALGLRKTRASSFFEVESKTPFQAIEEGRLASGIQQRTSPFVDSRGVFEFNRAMISARKQQISEFRDISSEFMAKPESFIGQEGVKVKGDEITLTPMFFEKRFEGRDLFKEGLVSAKKEFFELPKLERAKLTGGSVVQTGAQFGIGIGELGGTIIGNLGMQTFKEGEKPSVLGRTFKFGGKAGQIMTLPTTRPSVDFFEAPITFTKQKVTSPEFLTGAGLTAGALGLGGAGYIKTVRKLGFKEGTVEALTPFSPLAVKSGIYTAPITTKTKLDVSGVKMGDVTIFKGKGAEMPELKLAGLQKVKDGKGFGLTAFDIPFAEVRGGGAFTTFGTRTGVRTGTIKGVTGLEGEFKPTLSQQKPLVDIDALISPKGAEIDVFRAPKTKLKGAGIVKETDLGLNFVSGRRGRFDPKEALAVEKGTGRLTTFEPTIRGKIVDVNKLMGGFEPSRMISGVRGKPSLKTKQTFKDILPQPIQAPKPRTFPTQPTTISIAKTETIRRPSQALVFDTKQIQMAKPKMKDIQMLGLGLGQQQILGQKPRQRLRTIPILDTSQVVSPKLTDIQASLLGTSQRQKLRQKQKLGFRMPQEFGFDFGFRPVDFVGQGRGFFFIPTLPTLLGQEVKKKKRKGKRAFRRRPSLVSAEFLRFAERPAKAEITGLIARPLLRSPRKRRRK